ncbi:MAG TPA: TIR domain-containing protein [Solirubrobacterales bacterium]
MSSIAEAPPEASVQKVFICYRREETGAHAGRLYDAMVARFGEENVFMDLDLAPGVDFEKKITEVVSGCVALLVVIGPTWAQTSEPNGTRRIEDPADFVRLEVETALQRPEVIPIPVLVHGAEMPRREELPPELRPIARRNAIELSDGRWAYDVGRLMARLEELIPGRSATVPDRRPAPRAAEQAAPSWRLVPEGALVAGVTAALARRLGELIAIDAKQHEIESGAEHLEHIGAIVLTRTETFALTGAALAVWLALRVRRVDPFRHLLRGLLVGALAGLLGGVIWSFAVYLPTAKVKVDAQANIELAALAVTGGVLGSLIGSLWRPRRTGPAIVTGAIGGFLFQLLAVIATGWEKHSELEIALGFGLAAAAITAAALLELVYAGRSEGSHSGGSTGGIRPG